MRYHKCKTSKTSNLRVASIHLLFLPKYWVSEILLKLLISILTIAIELQLRRKLYTVYFWGILQNCWGSSFNVCAHLNNKFYKNHDRKGKISLTPIALVGCKYTEHLNDIQKLTEKWEH